MFENFYSINLENLKHVDQFLDSIKSTKYTEKYTAT